MNSVKGTLLRGTPGDAGRSCPLVDEAATVYVKHFARAINWCINGHAIPEHDRDSVFQEVRVRILLSFRRYGPVPVGTTSTYAVVCARRACADYRRSERKHRTPERDVDVLPTSTAPADEWLDRQDAHKRLHLAVATLPPMSREVMRLVLRGQSMSEVAAHYGITVQAAKSAAHRARVMLRKRLVR